MCSWLIYFVCVFAQLFSYYIASEPLDPNNTDKNAEKIEPMPSLADVKRVVTEHCILPLGKVWYWFIPIRTVQNVLIVIMKRCPHYIEATLYMYMIVICALLYMYMYMYFSLYRVTRAHEMITGPRGTGKKSPILHSYYMY